MNDERALPPLLRRAVLGDLARTRPLPAPWRRALVLAPAGLLLFWWIPRHFGLREDLAALGLGPSLGLSLLEWLVGLVLLAAALREAVPGRQLSGRLLSALGLGAAGTYLAVTLATARASASGVPLGAESRYLAVCLAAPVLLGLPLLVLASVLSFRAFPVRPALVGALAGLGCGLLVESAWRLFCEVTAPAHVLEAHGGAVAALGLAGAFGAWLHARLRRGR